jgi:neutral ceramidase
MIGSLFRAGAARVDITPAEPCDLAGFLLRDNPSDGVHDPIYARALALDDGSRCVVLVVCDLLGLEAGIVAGLRRKIEGATGVPAAHVMIACTHTHAAPASMLLIHCGEISRDWFARLREQIVEAAAMAVERLAPAQIACGRVSVPLVSANRRDATDVVDHDLDMVRIDGEGGPIAGLCVYGCHPVAAGHANRQVSADYFGVLAAALEQRGMVALATSGACGDINPAINGNPAIELPSDFSVVHHVGEALAAAAREAGDGLTPIAAPQLGVGSVQLLLPLSPALSEQELDEQVARWQAGDVELTTPAWAEREAAAMLAWAERVMAQRQAGARFESVAAEVQAITIGGLALVGVPGELFAAPGLEIKARSSARRTIVLGYANGNIGYIPTRAAYQLGGYEVASAYRFYGYPAAVGPEAGEMVVEAALTAITRADGG